MKKTQLMAATACLALMLAGTARASLPVDVELFMSGASAPSNMLRENIVQFACDQTQPIDVYVDFADQMPGAGNPLLAEPIAEHRTFWAVQCTANAGMGSAAGKTIAFYKTDAGGSGNGTTPVKDRVALQFMDATPANCGGTPVVSGQAHGNGGTYDLWACDQDDLVNQIPDMGASDVEASKFVGELAPGSGSFVNDGTVQEKAGPGLVFGVALTQSARNELQADQIAAGRLPGACAAGDETEACMPSLPSGVIRSLFIGHYADWSDVDAYGDTLAVPAAWTDPKKGNVHVCRRVQGSGTHAEFMIHYMRTTCYANSRKMLTQPGPGGSFFGAGPLVYENSSSGTLGSCLDALDTGAGYASSKITPDILAGAQSYGIAYQSTEKNMDLAKNYRFVKVDGVAPTLDNAVRGDYRQVYYLGFQNRKTGYDLGPLRASIDAAKTLAIQDMFDKSTNINASVVAVLNQGFGHSWGQGGFLTPDAAAPAIYTPGDPRTPWTRENAVGGADSCQPLMKKQ